MSQIHLKWQRNQLHERNLLLAATCLPIYYGQPLSGGQPQPHLTNPRQEEEGENNEWKGLRENSK